MTNYEKYREEIIKILTLGQDGGFALKHRKPCICDDTLCEECDFGMHQSDVCKLPNQYAASVENWMNAEYVEEPTLTLSEWHYCMALDSDAVIERLFGGDMKVSGPKGYIYPNFEPFKDISFSFIKNGDPWRVEDLLKLEVQK